MRRWLALAVLAIPMVCGWSVAKGETTTQGLTVVGYSINQIPPAQSDTAYPVCGSGWYENINQAWDSVRFGQCGWDRFMLHYSGFVTIPEGTQSVRWAVSADDGGVIKVGNTSFGTWRDKGCGIVYSDRVATDAGVSLPLDGWFYENGGGTCFRLWWQLDADNQNWEIVPASAFSFVEPPTTTLQETTTTTEPPTTSTAAPVVEVVPTVALVQPAPVVSTSDVSTSTTSTTTPTTTATPQTSSSTTSTTTTSSSTSTTTSTTTIATSTTTTPPAPATTTTLPDTPEPVFHNAEAVATITNQIATISQGEAAALFDQIDESSLTPTEAALLVEAVQSASVAIRQTFEKHINIYEGAVDTYVPIGSQVNVRARRVIIAVGLVLIVPAVPVRKPDA